MHESAQSALFLTVIMCVKILLQQIKLTKLWNFRKNIDIIYKHIIAMEDLFYVSPIYVKECIIV